MILFSFLCSHDSRILLAGLKSAGFVVPSASKASRTYPDASFKHDNSNKPASCTILSFSHGAASTICISPTGLIPLLNSTPPHPVLQASILESKVEVGEILAPVSLSKPVSLGSMLVGITGNQVAPPDSYAMFRHLMEAKVTRK